MERELECVSSVQSERERKVDSKMLRGGGDKKADTSGKLIFGLNLFLDYFPLLTVLSGFHGNKPLLP